MSQDLFQKRSAVIQLFLNGSSQAKIFGMLRSTNYNRSFISRTISRFFMMTFYDGGEDKIFYSEILNYIVHDQYPDAYCKKSKHQLRKRAKYFTHNAGRLYYVGGRKHSSGQSRFFVIKKVERKRIISTTHDQAHFGRDKTLAQVNNKYYWPDMYNEVCSYVSVQ